MVKVSYRDMGTRVSRVFGTREEAQEFIDGNALVFPLPGLEVFDTEEAARAVALTMAGLDECWREEDARLISVEVDGSFQVAGTFDTIRGTVVDEGLDDLIVRFAEEAI
jgi:hypothetical protein